MTERKSMKSQCFSVRVQNRFRSCNAYLFGAGGGGAGGGGGIMIRSVLEAPPPS